VVTVDADTLLHLESLRRLVSRLESAPADTAAVAGTVLVRNSRVNLLTRIQEWDYYLGIAAVKRMQTLYQATLVAQGAFSLYRTAELRRVGGWPDAIGEDIVVTWRLVQEGDRVLFEPTAVAFTDAPDKVAHFMRQRARWARGVLEGIAAVPPWRQPRRLTGFVAGIDLLIPLLDVGYVLIWLPGVALLILGGLRFFQTRRVFGPMGLRVRRNRFGYVAFLLGYQVLCSTASLAGYAQHLAGAHRRWK
jgi:poly-beta-1,6-N-acetyl-D-glucosamine synthase